MSVSRESFIGEVSEVFDAYQPNQQVLQQLGQIDLTTVSAPTGMGKDTLIASLSIPRVVCETIRAPRINNGRMEQDGVEYEFRGEMLNVVLGELRRGEHVQIGMGPGRDSFYGSRIASYPTSGPALIDVMTSQVDTMRQLPFRSAEPVFVVAPSYEAWQQRLSARGKLDPSDWLKRKDEAKKSLDDALSDERYTFILNDELSLAAQALHAFASRREQNPEAGVRVRNVARTIRLRLQD